MIERIVVFYGSKKDFESYLSESINDTENTIPFMELIQHYNARLRPNESGVKESALYRNIDVDNCVVRSDDYGSVLEHVIANFANIVTLNHDVGTLYIQNPPKRVLQSLTSTCPELIEFKGSEYKKVDRTVLKEIYKTGVFDEV